MARDWRRGEYTGQDMEPLAFIIVLAFVIGFAALADTLSETARLRRMLRNAPRITIREFRDGGVGKIVGVLEYHDAPLIAPLSQRACAYFLVEVKEQRGSGNNHYWHTIVSDTGRVRFRVRDATGYAIIDPAHAHLVVVKDCHSRSGTFDDPTPAEAHFLARYGQQGTGWVFNKTLSYREGILEAGEQVAVLGFGLREPDPEPPGRDDQRGYRTGPPTRLLMSGGQKMPLTISDEYESLR